MANIPLTGTGSFFARTGAILGAVNDDIVYLGTTVVNNTANINAQFLSTDQQVINGQSGLYVQEITFQGATQSWLSYLNGSPSQGLLQQTLVAMAVDSVPTLNPQTLANALSTLISQMTTAGASINRPTVTQVVTPGSGNTGNGVFTCSLVDPLNGQQFDYVFTETITATCTNDSYGHGGTAGQEPFSLSGPLAVGQYAWNWPQGSGVSGLQMSAFQPSQSNAVVTDGDFEVWGGAGNNTPTDWAPVTTGAAQITRSSSPYTGTYALQVTGDSATNVEIRQTVTLQPSSSYGFNIWAKGSAAVSAGVLTIQLLDANGTVLNDNASNPSSVANSLTSLTTGYTNLTGYLRTPAILATPTQQISLKMTTPVNTGTNVTLDRFGFVLATQLLQTYGPVVCNFSGSIPYAINDTQVLALMNNLGVWTFARSLDRMLNLRGLRSTSFNSRIPSSTSPTIADSLIVSGY